MQNKFSSTSWEKKCFFDVKVSLFLLDESNFKAFHEAKNFFKTHFCSHFIEREEKRENFDGDTKRFVREKKGENLELFLER